VAGDGETSLSARRASVPLLAARCSFSRGRSSPLLPVPFRDSSSHRRRVTFRLCMTRSATFDRARVLRHREGGREAQAL